MSLTAQHLEAIRDARRAGLSFRAIQSTLAEVGVHLHLAAIAKATSGVSTPAKRDTRAEVLEAFAAGASYRELADRFGVSTATVGKWARESGARPRPRGPRANPNRAALLEAYREGRSTNRALAERFGVCEATVTNWTRGIETKGPRRGRPRSSPPAPVEGYSLKDRRPVRFTFTSHKLRRDFVSVGKGGRA